MNRRNFLLGVGLIACSGSGATTMTAGKPKRPPKRNTHEGGSGGGDAPATGIQDSVWFDSQRRANRLAFHGDVLVQSVGDELRSWDATTMKRTDTWTLPHRHFCFVQDGSLIAFGWPAHSTSSAIHRVSNGKVETTPGPLLPSSGTNVLLPSRNSNELFITTRDDIYLVQLHKNAEITATFKHPAPNASNRDQWISRGNGRIVGNDREGGLHLLAAGDSTVSSVYQTPDRKLLHLAAASADRIWYSFADPKEDWNAHTLILAATDKPADAVRKIDVGPARVIHAASYSDTLAVLLFMMRSETDMTWTVALFDETGQEHWRADVAADFAIRGALNNGFIAVNTKRVVLAAPDGKLIAWNVEDGKLVG